MADSVTGEAEPAEPIASTARDVLSGLAQIISSLQLIAVDLQHPAIAGPDNNAITLQSVAGALQKHALRLQEMVDPVRSVLRPELFYQAGVVAAADERYEKAAGFFRRALELRTEYSEAHTGLGNVLWKLGKLEEAVTHYERALALKPGNAEAHIKLRNALQAQGKFSETNTDPTSSRRTSSQRKYFRGFYINLDRSVDRREKFEINLRSHNLEKFYKRFPAANGNALGLWNPHLRDGELGCYTSHYMILKQNLESPEHLHVIEDDVIFSKHAHGIMDDMLVSGHLTEYDIIFTDISIPILNRDFKWYKSLYDRLVERNSDGKIRKFHYEIIDLKDKIFFGTASYLVSSTSIGKLYELLHNDITNSPKLPIDSAILRFVRQGLLKAGCVFPFITTQNLEYVIDTTVADRLYSQPLVMPFALARRAFFIDCNFDELQNYAAQYLDLPTDSHHDLHNLLSSILGFSLTSRFRTLSARS